MLVGESSHVMRLHLAIRIRGLSGVNLHILNDWGNVTKGPFWPLVVITFHDASIQSHPDTSPVKCESVHLSERGNVTRGPFWPLVVTTFHDASLEGHPDTGPVRSESPHLSEWGNVTKGPFGHWW